MLNAVKIISVLIFLVRFGPNELKNSTINFMHLVFVDCGVVSSEAIRLMIYCVMCCEYVGPRERTEKTMNCCIYFLFCLVKFS